MNSLSVLIVHLTGAERYWLGDVIAGDPSRRDRDAEFSVQGWTREKLIQRLSDSETYVRSIFERMTLQDLEGSRVSPRNGRIVSVGYALENVLKHSALHVGHIQITRQLWEQQ